LVAHLAEVWDFAAEALGEEVDEELDGVGGMQCI
jgi:hypothetical protein